MKQTLHTSRRAFKLALLCLMAFVTWGGNYCIAQETASLVFTKAPENGKATDTKNMTWSVSSDGAFFGCEKVKGLHYGSAKKAVKAIDVSTSAYADVVIKKIVVNASAASSVDVAYVKCEVGGAAFGVEQKIVSTKGAYTFEGNASGNILVSVYKPELKTGALYIKSIEITYSTANLKTTTLTLTAPDSPISIGGTYTSTPTLKAGEQTLSDKTITWSSDNEKVATVDAATGTVTGVAAGKANITAKFAGDDTYKTSTAKYEIKVKGAPALSFPNNAYTIEMGDAFSEPTLQGLPTDVTAKYSSSNADVATVDESTGKVQIVGVGTTTIKAVSEAKDVYEAAEASYELTVKLATSKEVTIDFSKFGYTYGQNVTEVSQNGIKLLFAKDTKYGAPAWYAPAVRMYKKSSLKITATSNIKKIEFVFDGTNSLKGVTCTSGKYDEAKGLWIFTDVKTKEATITNGETKIARIQKIIVTTELPTSAGAINIATEEGFGTFYTDKNYVLPQGLTAFGYTSIDGNTLTKSVEYVAGDIVPANTAVVVKGAKGSYNYYNTEETATKTIEKNLLKGVTTDTRFEATSGVKRYILTRADDGILAFYRTNSGTINVKANRAYLEVPTAMAVASFSLEGSATGINNVVTTAAKQGIYTISGVRLNATTTKELPAGIYIVDGKKVIVK